MAAFWAVLTFGGSGPALTAHGSLDLKQEIQIQIQTRHTWRCVFSGPSMMTYLMDSLGVISEPDRQNMHVVTFRSAPAFPATLHPSMVMAVGAGRLFN
jgi:hypothetical protein